MQLHIGVNAAHVFRVLLIFWLLLRLVANQAAALLLIVFVGGTFVKCIDERSCYVELNKS